MVTDLSGSPSVRSMIWMLRDSVSSRAHCEVEGACEEEQGVWWERDTPSDLKRQLQSVDEICRACA